jgi:hypothetical protein
MSYIEGNIIKYTTRYKFKNGIEDLKEAKWGLSEIQPQTIQQIPCNN